MYFVFAEKRIALGIFDGKEQRPRPNHPNVLNVLYYMFMGHLHGQLFNMPDVRVGVIMP